MYRKNILIGQLNDDFRKVINEYEVLREKIEL